MCTMSADCDASQNIMWRPYANHSKQCDYVFTSQSDDATTFLAGAGHDNFKNGAKMNRFLGFMRYDKSKTRCASYKIDGY